MADKLIFEMEINAKMDKALDEIKEINDGTKDINENLEAIKDSSKIAETGISGISKGFKGLGLAMKSAGVGLIIEAFNFLKDILMENQRVVDTLSIVFDSLSIVFNQVSTFAIDLGEEMFAAFSNPKEAVINLWDTIKTNILNRVEGLIDTFGAVGKVIKSALDLDWEGMKEGASEAKTGLIQMATGLDEVQQNEAWETLKTGAETIYNTGKRAVETATELTKLRNSVVLLEAEQEKLNFGYLKEQELLRQTRDDATLTIDERIAANQKLGDSLTQQLEDEKAIVMEKLRLARMESEANSENIELQAEVIRKEAELLDLEERITGFRSEQKLNEVALLQEQKDAENEILEEAARKQKERDEEVAKNKEDLAKQEAIRIENEKKRVEAAEKTKIDSQKKAYSMAKGLFAENEKVSKAFALGEIAVNTGKAISSLVATAQANPLNAVTFGSAGLAQYAVGLLQIMTNIKAAKDLLKNKNATPPPPDDSGGSNGGTQSVSAPSPSTPQTPSFDLAGSTEMFMQQPVQAFVIQQDVQDQSELNEQIQNRATL
jgi:hypothetical protein